MKQDDLISRQEMIDFYLDRGMITAAIYAERIPRAEVEPLTDIEQRIFLAAMGKEEKVCKKTDEEFETPYAYKLEFVCREITRKVKKALWTN